MVGKATCKPFDLVWQALWEFDENIFLQPFNASRRLEGKDTKTAAKDNILGTAFESAFALEVDDHASEISGRQNCIVFPTAVIFPTTSKFQTIST